MTPNNFEKVFLIRGNDKSHSRQLSTTKFESNCHPNLPVRLSKKIIIVNSMLSGHTSIYDQSYATDNIKNEN